MLHELAQRVSWICLLLFSSAFCFPANDGFQYPYTDGSIDQLNMEEPAPESTMAVSEDDVFSPRSGDQQPATQAENQAPSASAAASWVSYQPSGYDVSSTDKPVNAPQSSGGAPSFSHYAAPAATYSAPAVSHYAAPAATYSAPAVYHKGGHASSGAGATSGQGVDLTMYHGPGASGGFGGYSAPAASYGYGYGYDAAPEGPSSAGTLVYSSAPSFRFEESFGNEYAELPRAGFESFNPSGWMPSRSFPDFTVWGSEEEAANVGAKGAKGAQQEEEEEVETFSVPSSSYIVQTRNGYQRAREVSSHMNYSPALPEPAVIYYEVLQKAAPQAEPVKGGKGGKQ